MHKTPLTVAGIVFALVALLQLSRLYLQFPMLVNDIPVPLWANGVAFAVASMLSYWMFHAANQE